MTITPRLRKSPNWALLALLLGATGNLLAQLSTTPPERAELWKSQQVSPYFWGEGAAAADVNRDGHMDILAGPYWYAGPDFATKHVIYPDTQRFTAKRDDGTSTELPGYEGALGTGEQYSENFIVYSHDLNDDGFPDYLVIGFPGKETFWYENPGKNWGQPWKCHVVLDSTDNESPQLIDVDGDGRPELVAMSGGTIGYARQDPSKPGEKWHWLAVSPPNPDAYQRYTHGIGAADINGDGRVDLLEAGGWWEQPAEWDGKTPWPFHRADFGRGGAQMYGHDVNGDGRMDVITSLHSHEWGLAWFEQNADGSWTRHLITGTPEEKGNTDVMFSQMHAIELADLDGDGLTDIVTGKRLWAHGRGGDPEPGASPVVYAFLLRRKGQDVSFQAQLISPHSGVGTGFCVADMNGDGKPDVVTSNKKGTYLHLQK